MRRFRSGLTALIPEGWLVRESIEMASTVESAYVVATVFAAPAETTVAEYVEKQGAHLREQLPGFEGEELAETTLANGRSAFVRKFYWRPQDGERIAELQLYASENGRGIVASARVPDKQFGELEPKLRELLSGFAFGGHAPSGGLFRRDDSPVARTYAAYEGGDLATTPAKAFGLEDAQAETSSDQVTAAWRDARSTWQQAGEEL